MAAASGLSALDPENPPFLICLLAALLYEVRPFLRLVKAGRRRDLSFPAWEFQVGKGRGLVAISGVGEAATRHTGTQLLSVCRPRIFLSVGFGGAITPEVQPGTVIAGSAYWQYSPESGALREILPPLFSLRGADLANRLTAAGIPAFAGSIVTAPAILTKARHRAAFRHLQYPVLDQETATAAEVAAAQGVAFLGLRAVTDAAGEEIPGFVAEAMNVCKTPGPFTVFEWLARRPRRIVQIVHLWRRSNLAAHNLARALESLLLWI